MRTRSVHRTTTVPAMYPQPQPAPVRAPAARRFPVYVPILAVLAAFIVVVVGSFVAWRLLATRPAAAPQPTSAVTSCAVEGDLITHFRFTVTNNDTHPHDYVIEGTVGSVGSVSGTLNGVGPGQTATGDMPNTGHPGTCVITQVLQLKG